MLKLFLFFSNDSMNKQYDSSKVIIYNKKKEQGI